MFVFFDICFHQVDVVWVREPNVCGQAGLDLFNNYLKNGLQQPAQATRKATATMEEMLPC